MIKEIEIPEGYEVKIENNKVIFVPKESEDERIRKELLEEIEFIIPHDDETDSEGLILPSYHARIDRYKSYLEKQKEQKPAENPKWYDSMDEFYADALIEMVEKSDLIDRDKKNRLVWIEKHRAKPTEWSEEDEDSIEQAIIALEDLVEHEGDCYAGHHVPFVEAAKRLKSLRPQPHWKPSEEQMEALSNAYRLGKLGKMDMTVLQSLYNCLKKLM